MVVVFFNVMNTVLKEREKEQKSEENIGREKYFKEKEREKGSLPWERKL